MMKILQISDKLFWGFNMIVDISNYSSFDDLSELIKKDLLLFLNRNNLLNLALEAEKLRLHNHNYDNYNDLYKSNDDVIYFCSHCCCT
jgi:hypothetical protein